MFKFDFDLQGAENDSKGSPGNSHRTHVPTESQTTQPPPFMASTVDDFVEDLPPLISYSPLRIPLPDGLTVTLLRRDLFDARFQQISEDKEPRDIHFIDAPSDLVPGVYEGGLKTWECSVDLAAYLDDIDILKTRGSYTILEIGCGTAIPSLNLLRKVFSDSSSHPKDQGRRIMLHLQDYNFTALQLMTLPNIILSWYASPASSSYRVSRSLPVVNLSEPGELAITPELISSFIDALRQYNIELSFFSGSWTDMETRVREERTAYNLVISSETIYQSASLPSLVSLFKAACTSCIGEEVGSSPSKELAQFSASDSEREPVLNRCLVAAKVIYFGVGGGIDEFQQAIKEAGGRLNTVFEKKAGVGRRIMSLDWVHTA